MLGTVVLNSSGAKAQPPSSRVLLGVLDEYNAG